MTVSLSWKQKIYKIGRKNMYDVRVPNSFVINVLDETMGI